VFVISIWFVQSFVEFKVIAGRQILVIYIPRVYSNKIYRSYVLCTYNMKSRILYMRKYLILKNCQNDFTLNIQQSVPDQYKRKFRYALKAILLLDVKDKKPIN
jgi:hypothetical protein